MTPDSPTTVRVGGEATDPSEFAFVHARKKPVVIRAVRIAVAFEVDTLEGTMTGNPGDWLIEGVNGELYPCKPEIFAKTYEVLTE